MNAEYASQKTNALYANRKSNADYVRWTMNSVHTNGKKTPQIIHVEI